jgi:y4mF family transcriptional regulator
MTPPIQAQPIVDARTLGLAIRARRKHDGLTLAEVAGLTNVGIRFLSELENGKPTVRLDKLLHVIAALGLQLQIVPLSTAAQTWER